MLEKLKLSCKACVQINTLTVTAMMLALSVVLSFFTIEAGPFLKIGFSGVPIGLVGMLFGPVAGGAAGAIADLIKFFIKPTGPYFFGFTLDSMLTGMIYGFFLFRRKFSVVNVFLCKLTIAVFINITLNTYWLTVVYNKAIAAILPMRILTNAIKLPVDTVILFFIGRIVLDIVKRYPKISQLRN